MCTERQRGVTLVELLVFIVIVGIAVGGVLGVMNYTTSHGADPLRRKQALMVAESLMEEVQLAYFTYCDPSSPDADQATSAADCDIAEDWGQAGAEPANARPYDNINDYVAAPGTPVAAFNAGASIADASGTPFEVNGMTATVAVAPAALNGIGAAGTAADTPVLRITVTVAYDGDSIVLDAYRTRYAPR